MGGSSFFSCKGAKGKKGHTIMAGFKLKTRKAAAKRFRKVTGTGKIVRSKGAHGHFLSKRGQQARDSQGTTLVHESNYDQVCALLPNLGAKRKRTQALKNAMRRAKEALSGTKPAAKKAVAVKAPVKKAAPKAAASAE